MNIVFMGTPDFAVHILERLISDGHRVTGVFTQADKPQGRHQVLTPPPVKVCALEHNIPVYQPQSIKNGEAMPILEELQPDLIVVAAYGKILRSDVLHFPKYGCINVHASLLPKYRGAAPINWCIINGEAETGVTTMLMNEGMDTGDMLVKMSTPIEENETAGELFERLAVLGADTLTETLKQLQEGTLVRTPQSEEGSCYASMLSKKDSPIDWTKSAQAVHNQIRGLSPWPGASSVLEEKVFKIHQSILPKDRNGTSPSQPGQISVDSGRMFVTCGDGNVVELLQVQPFGSRKMDTKSYLLGHAEVDGKILTLS